MAREVLQEVETYISLLHNTVVKYIANRLILDLCLEEYRRPGKRVSKWWWVLEGLYLVGMWKAAWELVWEER